MHELTVDYLKTRQQFGREIGSFQVLQHRAVDMLIALEQARSMAMFATMMADGGQTPRSGATRISAAKVQIGRSGRLDRPAGDPAAWRHRHDDGVQGRPLLQAHDDDRHDVRRCRPSFARARPPWRIACRIGPNFEVILACPACRIRYLVDEQDLNRPTGRTVRCASCGHTWRQSRPLVARDREPAAFPTAARPEPELGVPPRPVPLPVPAPQRRPRRRSTVSWVVLSLVFVLLVLVVLAVLIARGDVLATWPVAARLHNLAGLPTMSPGTGLELGEVIPTRTADGLIVEGDITNAGDTVREVPRLRVALRNPDERETQFKIIDPPIVRLEPGETAHFKTSFEDADETATVKVSFVPR